LKHRVRADAEDSADVAGDDPPASLGRKTTVMVVWIPVAAMSAVTPWQNKPGTMFPSGWVGPASDPVCGDIAAFQV